MTLAKTVTKTLDIGVKDTKIDLSATIKSYDLTDTKFIFNVISNQGLNIDLTGSTAMYIVEYVHNSQNYAIQGEVDIVDSTTIAFSLPEDLKGYRGTAIIGLYVKLTDGTKIDIKDIIVRIEPSIIDKDIDFTAKTYFKDFESIKAEVILEGEKAKTNINAVVSDVDSYADSQKQAINNIVDDVQSTGDTAKADIKATLPSIQKQVSELKSDLADLTSTEKSANIWDGSIYSDENGSKGYTLHPTTGLPLANDSFVLSDFIEIDNTKEYSFYGLYFGTIVNPRINRFAFYDANKSIIGNVNSTGQLYHNPAEISRFACENGAKYLRFATPTGYEEYNIMLLEYNGSIPTEYIPYSVKKYLSDDVKVKAQNIDGEIKPNGYDELKEKVNNIYPIIIPDIVLPSVIPCIAGTALNIYYRNLFRQSGDRMKCFLAKGKGESYSRAYHYEATSGQSQFELTFNYSDDLYISGKKSFSTQVKPVIANGKPLNILIVGDSFTFMSYWQKGLYTLLQNSGYTPTYIGRTGFSADEMAECRSGAQMKHYTRDTARGGTVKVVPSTPLTGKISSGALYSDGVNSYKYWVYAHNENLVEFGTFDGSVADLPTNGTFTLVSGAGPATIPYSSIIEYGCVNPFYNVNTRKLDFEQYVSKWATGKVPDVCILQFMLNDVKPWSDETAVEASIAEYKTFINALHSDYPDCKIIISIEPMGAIYNSGTASYTQDDTNGGKYSQMIFAKRIIEEFDKNTSYGEYVWISASYAQVDCENGYELGEKVLSNRLPNIKDKYGLSSIHCSEDGMYMISDAVFPCVVDATN